MDALEIINLNNSSTGKSIGTALKEGNQNESFKETLLRSIDGIKKQGMMGKGNNKLIDKKLKDLCIQMESIFVSKMLKTMRDTVPKNEFIHGGFAEEIFEDMLYDEYAKTMSERANLGLATMLYDELSKK